ncbi:MAG: DUF3592 domain-containing protein [Chlorogloeopsis fritschii C42_A2020_084]|uniref:DUF3592 domain-containing protein n=1 Tax=Chlorogloeopsis fritschii TaxID=1124 RepID=UPI0019E7A96E|nr:DUF3592 domain-containing protein [Chlorogloeopsis fritschii]MBF2007665.1 DUF3592 domain-containing protein [Chlorogloeopsis fritschii C42_A2020_084]
MDDSKFFLIFGSIFGGIGGIFAVIGIIFGVNTHSFVGTALSTQGTVIDLELRSSTDSKGRSSSVYYPVVKFAPSSGEQTIFKSNTGSNPPAFTKGQQVEVLYNPQKPNSAMINSWLELWFLPAMFTGMGLIFVLIGGVTLVKSFPHLLSFKYK